MNSKADTPLCSVGYRVVEPCGRLPFRSDARGDILIPKYLLFLPSRLATIMPPKRASASKRKASSPVTDEEKRSKVPRVEETTETTQPTNKVLPVNIEFPPRVDGCLRLATWNIAGWNASQKKVLE